MKAVGIIPARLSASRFPNKPMALLHGMPMIGHCYHRTRLTTGLEATYVATCDEQIAEYIRGIGGRAIMTSTSHTRATTRTAEALQHIERETGEPVDIIVMVQGDEPLIRPETIAETLIHFEDSSVQIVNVNCAPWRSFATATMSRWSSTKTGTLSTSHANLSLLLGRVSREFPCSCRQELSRSGGIRC